MKKISSLSIFFPVYNDANTIDKLVKKAYSIGTRATNKIQVIVVNDGSTDEIKPVLHKLKKKFPALVIANHKKNRGYGAALRTGFSRASKSWVFYTDGDGQYDLNDLPRLAEKITNNIDVVNGYKSTRNDSLARIVIGNVYNQGLHWLYKLPIRDIDCDFRLIRKSALDKIKLQSDSGMICLELIVKLKAAGARFAEMSVFHHSRIYGRSQFFTIANLAKTAKDHLLFYFNYKRGKI